MQSQTKSVQCALTSVNYPFDDCSHPSLQQGAEQFDDEDEAGAEHQQRQSQKDQTHCHVGQVHIHKEVGTLKTQIITILDE